MKKQLFIALVILMCISLLGTVAVQFFWFRNSVKVKNELFDRTVNEALVETVKQLEINRDIHYLQRIGKQGVTSWDDMIIPPPPPRPTDVTGSIVVRVESDSTSEKYDIISNGNKFNHRSIMKVVRKDTPGKNMSHEIRIIQSDSLVQLKFDSLSFSEGSNFDIMVKGKARQLEKLAQNIKDEFKGWKDGRNIDLEKLNVTLSNELKKRDIPILFHYSLMAGDSILRGDYQPLASDRVKWHKADLFPNDILKRNLQLAVYFPDRNLFVGHSMNWLMAMSALFTTILLIVFLLSLFSIIRQKKISEMKSDFINNMTHEFKTPIATISLASDSILNKKVIDDPDQVRFFAGMIQKENKRMNKQVERILQIARLDRKEFDFHAEPVNVHDLILEAIQSINFQVNQKEGVITTELHAIRTVINTDPTHFISLIYNLLDNANKFSPEKPKISVTTISDEKGIYLAVEDQGIGMSKAVVGKIFDKFYRQPTGNVHTTKGFGLGLSYVKAIVEANKGTIKVKSEIGKGSKFEIFIPFTI